MLIDCLRNGKEKEYKIVSYSKTPIIGKNLTLLKTEYGVIVFDCGAAVSSTGEKNNYTFTSINETAVLEMLDELLSLGETMLDNKININSHKYKEKCNQFFKLLSNHSQYENLLKNAKVCITTVKNCTIFFGIMLILHIHLFS